MLKALFVDHPRAVGETYAQHRGVALSFAGELLAAGLACAVHAFVPGLFTRAASETIERLHARMVDGRRRRAIPPAGSPAGLQAETGG